MENGTNFQPSPCFVIVFGNDCLMILLAFRNNSASMIVFNFVQKWKHKICAWSTSQQSNGKISAKIGKPFLPKRVFIKVFTTCWAPLKSFQTFLLRQPVTFSRENTGIFHVLPSYIINYFCSTQHNHFYAVISELWVSWKDIHIRR